MILLQRYNKEMKVHDKHNTFCTSHTIFPKEILRKDSRYI